MAELLDDISKATATELKEDPYKMIAAQQKEIEEIATEYILSKQQKCLHGTIMVIKIRVLAELQWYKKNIAPNAIPEDILCVNV